MSLNLCVRTFPRDDRWILKRTCAIIGQLFSHQKRNTAIESIHNLGESQLRAQIVGSDS